MGLRTICRRLALGMVIALASLNASAGITYQFVNQAEPSGMPDKQRIDYLVDSATPSFFGYTLYFDPGMFTDLQLVSSDANWFPSIAQPDPSFPLPGLVSLLALTDFPAGVRFSVEFTWLGSTDPGAQMYEMFDDAFTIIDSGMTQAATPTPNPVPEPASAMLMLAGLGALMRQRYRP